MPRKTVISLISGPWCLSFLMGAIASQITSLTIVYSTVYCSTSLAFLWGGIHRWPVNSPHKGPVTRKIFSFDDVIMQRYSRQTERTFPSGHWIQLLTSPRKSRFVCNRYLEPINSDSWCFYWVTKCTRIGQWLHSMGTPMNIYKTIDLTVGYEFWGMNPCVLVILKDIHRFTHVLYKIT